MRIPEPDVPLLTLVSLLSLLYPLAVGSSSAYGYLPSINLSPMVLPKQLMSVRELSFGHGASSHHLQEHLASVPSRGHHFVPFRHSTRGLRKGRGSSPGNRYSTPSPQRTPAHPPETMPPIQAGSMLTSPIFAPSKPPGMWTSKPMGSSPAASPPAFSPSYQGFGTSPDSSGGSSSRSSPPKQYKLPHAVSPASFTPSHEKACDQIICSDPLTSTPIGSPCGCVLPMQVELALGVAPYAVFPLVGELEIEVAAGTYLKQSQVRIMGATADSQDQGKTVVNIDLVPLGEKFDNTTALLTYKKFWHKKVAINKTLFGNYEVIYVHYPGLPSSLPSSANGGTMGIDPSGAMVGGSGDPFGANVSRSKKMNAKSIAVIVLSSFFLFLICFGALWILLLKWRKLGRPSTAVGPVFSSPITKRSGVGSMLSSSIASSTSLSLVSTMATCILSVKTFSLAELEKATDRFSSKKILGEGGFGRVYLGIMEDGSEVAVKLLTREDQNGDREFIAEVEMLSRLHHRNLVKLIGICIEEHTRCLVYELVHNGSVESHLHGVDKRRAPLDWDARMKIALGAARGLAYLHEDSNPRVIHRDFKASNVLLEDDFTPKVSDFGLAREASEGSRHISTRVMGTFGYVAPEYAMTGHLLVKSDVYSYGVVLLELLSGRKPVDMSQPPGQENLVTWARPLLTSREGLQQLLDPSLGVGTDGYNFNNMARVAAIASMCVHPEVSQRPFMGEVVQALKLVYNDDTNETCGRDSYSQRGEESSGPDCDYYSKGVEEELVAAADSSWWHGSDAITPPPCLAYAYTSSFITMDYSSGPLEETTDRRPLSASTLIGGIRRHREDESPLRRHNRSGPLRTMRNKPAFYRLKGSMSEHGFLGRHVGIGDYYWV